MTQETGNNTTSLLNTSISRESTLLVEWSADFFCYSIFHQPKNEVIHSHVGESFIDLADWTSDQFARLLKDEAPLGLQYQKTIQFVNTPWVTLVPTELLEVKAAESILRFNLQLPATPLVFKTEKVANTVYTMVYAIPKDLEKVLKESFTSVEIKSMAAHLLTTYLAEEQEQLYLHFSNALLQVSYIKEGQLHFFNQFQCNSSEDALYNILNVMQQLELDTEKCVVKCAGNIVAMGEKYQLLQSYIRHVELQSRSVKLNYAEAVAEMPNHYFGHHYKQFLR